MNIGKIEISLDKKWELKDLSVVTKEYVQLYSFFYVTRCVSEGRYMSLDFSKYPWGGGYSVINFFRRSYSLTNKEHRLQVTKIHYASPGVIEISGVIHIAADVTALVSSLCASATVINKTYNGIITSYNERKLGSIKIQEAESNLIKEDIKFISSSVLQLINEFELSSENIEAIDKISNENTLVQLKMLLALYKRAQPIVKQQESGKMKLQ